MLSQQKTTNVAVILSSGSCSTGSWLLSNFAGSVSVYQVSIIIPIAKHSCFWNAKDWIFLLQNHSQISSAKSFGFFAIPLFEWVLWAKLIVRQKVWSDRLKIQPSLFHPLFFSVEYLMRLLLKSFSKNRLLWHFGKMNTIAVFWSS